MQPIVHKISIDLTNNKMSGAVNVQKNGNCDTLEIYLTNKNQPYVFSDGVHARIRALKSDGTKLFNDCITGENSITYKITSQTVSVSGLVMCQLLLYDNNENLLYSPKFDLVVNENVYDDDGIESTNEYTALTEALSKADNVLENAQKSFRELNNAVVKADNAAENAQNAAKEANNAVNAANDAVRRAEKLEKDLSWWFGTREEYNLLSDNEKENYTLYFIEEGT